jgi:hypothetical protein
VKYREWETATSLLFEQRATDRLATYWRGRILPAAQYESFDRVLCDTDGSTAALLEIKVRHYELRYFVAHKYMLSLSKVRSLRAAAKQRNAVPLVMVVCEDDDFLLDLRDESGTAIRTVKRINDRWYDETDGETIWQPEEMMLFSGSRFLPLFTLPNLL